MCMIHFRETAAKNKRKTIYEKILLKTGIVIQLLETNGIFRHIQA